MVRICTLIFILVGLVFSQQVKEKKKQGNSKTNTIITIKINTEKDTVVKKRVLFRLKDELKKLKFESKEFRKELRKQAGEKYVRKIKEQAEREIRKGLKRVYYIVCSEDTTTLKDGYDFYDSSKWDRSRASLDSLCRVIESKLNKKQIKQIKKAYKKGLIKEYGIWPKKMKRLYKYLNNPANNFIINEIK